MENVFPLQETVEIEQIYGSKRENARAPNCSKTFIMNKRIVLDSSNGKDERKEEEECLQSTFPCSTSPTSSSFVINASSEVLHSSRTDTINDPSDDGVPTGASVDDQPLPSCNLDDRCTKSVKSGWFSEEGISVTEEIGMGDVIQTIGRERYMENRNEILRMYKKSAKSISISDVMREISIDMYSLMRIFSFLERWEMINRKDLLWKELKLLASCNVDTQREDEDVNTESIIPAAASSLQPQKPITSQLDPQLLNTPDHQNLEHLNTPDHICETHISVTCDDCMRTEGPRKAEFFTNRFLFKCAECVDEGMYPVDVSRSDFNAITEEIAKNMWSKMEEFLLLDGIGRYGDQWGLVSKHVGTKTMEQCAFRFLSMSIVESALVKADFSRGMPFEAAENPVMCVVAFVSGMVHPVVGAECAKTAMKYIGSLRQDALVHRILDAGRKKAIEQAEQECKKIKRLDGVICEALLGRIRMKIGAYKELHGAIPRVQRELVMLRRTLAEEFEDMSERSSDAAEEGD